MLSWDRRSFMLLSLSEGFEVSSTLAISSSVYLRHLMFYEEFEEKVSHSHPEPG